MGDLKQCSCRKKSIQLLVEIQRLTGDLIELEHKARNMTIEDIPEGLRREISAQALEQYLKVDYANGHSYQDTLRVRDLINNLREVKQ